MTALFDQITIVGMGLMGGSVGLSVKKKKIAKRVVALARNPKARAAILKAKAADAVFTDYVDAIPGSQLVLLAVPVSAMEACAKDVWMHVAPEAAVTDVGSVKQPVVAALEKIFARKGKFVGSHPMAGSEKSGMDAARADLFDKALCIVTPSEQTDPKALRSVQKFWASLGCRISLVGAGDHDRIIAAVSHLPHVLASALMHTALKASGGYEDPMKFIGPSFRDMTRVAASSPELWADILLANRREVLRCLAVATEQLEGVAAMLESPDKQGLMEFFDKARALRNKIS